MVAVLLLKFIYAGGGEGHGASQLLCPQRGVSVLSSLKELPEE